LAREIASKLLYRAIGRKNLGVRHKFGKLKEVEGRKRNFRPSWNAARTPLEPELRPKQQVAERWFDSILLVQITACTDIQQIDIQRTDVVVVCKVLRLNPEDEHAPLKVKPG
jgi:hypothetical protein